MDLRVSLHPYYSMGVRGDNGLILWMLVQAHVLFLQRLVLVASGLLAHREFIARPACTGRSLEVA